MKIIMRRVLARKELDSWLDCVCVHVFESAERRAQLVRSRSRQNILQDETEVARSIEFEDESQSPQPALDSAKQRVRRPAADRHPGKISGAALDNLMAST